MCEYAEREQQRQLNRPNVLKENNNNGLNMSNNSNVNMPNVLKENNNNGMNISNNNSANMMKENNSGRYL